jgi:hypothetical protein
MDVGKYFVIKNRKPILAHELLIAVRIWNGGFCSETKFDRHSRGSAECGS